MALRVSLCFLLLLVSWPILSSALYEDQVGLADWHQKYIGKTKQAVFHTQKAGRKRVVVSTEENVIASLDLRSGDIFWRHVLGQNDVVDQIDIALGKYVVTLSSEGSLLRAWNLPDGQLIWESSLQVLKPSKSLLHVSASKDNLILVFSGGCLRAVSGIDGEVVWEKEFSSEGLDIQTVSQPLDSNIAYVVGFSGPSQVIAYQISAKSGNVLKQSSLGSPSGFSGEALQVSSDMLMALDATRSTFVSVNFQGGEISFQRRAVSNIVEGFSRASTLVPVKSDGVFAAKVDEVLILVQVKDNNELELIEKINHPSAISDALSLSEDKQAFAILQHEETKIQLRVKVNNDFRTEVLKETIDVDPQRGYIEKVFINSYVRTDRSHGFRALIVMEDHSLLLVQQGEVVWSREDGLASIIGSTTSELPVEKVGVSVAKVEENLLEWLKGHMLKLKGTLRLASTQDVAAIQGMRLKNSEKIKVTRDHNGFRKLIIVLTKARKVFALHTGDGRVVWSLLIPSLHRSKSCQHPSALNIYQWHVPHHHAMDENPSLLVVGRCGLSADAPGLLSIVDSYTGKELSSLNLPHSMQQVISLPWTDSEEQRLHLIMDGNSRAHLYPETPDAIGVFLREMSNIYWYSVDAEKDIIRGHSLSSRCSNDVKDEYCFSTKDLWSIVFLSESEKISTIATRKMNEVVHTQAKAMADQDVMYKYLSKNIIFLATVAPKAAGEIGSATPEEAWLVAYLIDAVTGRIMHRVTHQGAQGPIHAVVSENWVVYHYFNLRAHRYEMSVIEIYDQSRADNKDIWKLIVGKHNLTSPVTSFSRPEVVVKSQTYFFTHSVKTMAVTYTAKGITSKQLLIGTISDQILALDKRYLDPRRTANPSQSEREEGIIPLTDALPTIPQSYITHSLQVEGLRGIVTFPAKLESTTLTFSYGIDLFFTRIAPSRTYDSLTEDFSYALLLITIIALVGAIFATWILSEKKELREKWQ